ncbi:related to permease of the major facilitator superfamily [Armillaria ostoyae]|uniref:Related to permease of the major facilitator superfamily n=1 Tax=Armillaria ostoyae TaxID=47428 RepID=A0A284RA53_ARMOS|nr:related to permease of the major facilitator superfamily [Armillaria ostoyae]
MSSISSQEKDKQDVSTVQVQNYEEEYEEFKALSEKYQGDVLTKLLRKIDCRLVPVFALLYLMSFLDRGNVGNAKVAGLTKTIPMTDKQYNTALSLFFVFYIVFEIPSQMMLKKFRPKWYISCLTLSWGLVMSLTCLIQSYRGFMAARSFLGITESGLFPAAGYTLSMWYSRSEMASRVALFFCAASVAGALSGILAYGISFMDGLVGMEGWRWIFLVEGLMTIVLGLLGPLIILDSTAYCGKWLSDEEKKFLILRQRYTETGPVPPAEHFDWKYVKMAFTDWQMIFQIGIYVAHGALGILFCFCSINFVSMLLCFEVIPSLVSDFIVTLVRSPVDNPHAVTLPVIIKSLEFTTYESYLIPVPIYIAACVLTYFNSWWGDRRRSRFLHIVVPFTGAIIGVAICFATAGKKHIAGVNLFGLILIVFASYSPVPTSVSWMANNVIGYKKVIAMGMLMGIGNCSGLIGSNIYLTSESPKYQTGYGVSLALAVMGITCAIVLRIVYARENKSRDLLTVEDIARDWDDKKLQVAYQLSWRAR